MDAEGKSKILWETFRNPFAHSLGLAYEKRPGQRVLKPRSFITKVGRAKKGMKEREIVALERSASGPDEPPTLVVKPHKRVLWVELFYWGVRTMLFRLSRDTALMADVGQYVDGVLAGQTGTAHV